MISIFDDNGNRLSVTYNGIELNDPTLTRHEQTGFRLETAAFSTPANFHSEAVSDVVKNGGGIEYYNPHVGTRVINLRGSIRASTESALMKQIVDMQRAFHPLLLQSEYGLNEAGTLTWPPPGGLPDWVRALPLKFTRVMPRTEAPSAFSNTGLFTLQYHVAPLGLPDPVRSSVAQGVGVDYEAEFLILDGGRSFDQTESTLVGDGTVTWTWGQAPVWPEIEFTLSANGASNLTITTTQGHMGTALVLDCSALGAADVRVDCRNRQIYVDDVATDAPYVSGDFPILRGQGATTVAWTNTTNVTASSNLVRYRQSDYI